MLNNIIENIVNKPRTTFGTYNEELVKLYFDRSIEMVYVKILIDRDELVFESSHCSDKTIIKTNSESQKLFDILEHKNKCIDGSESTIPDRTFKELWKMLYSADTDVLIIPCYVTSRCVYALCIKDFINLKSIYDMNILDENITILDEFPLLYFTLKHCLYDYYFESKDSTWRFIIGCGNMVQAVKIINNVFQYHYIPGLELFQELSNMPYEGMTNMGVIDFIDTYENKLSGYKLKFIDKCVLYKSQGRVLRKYLQLSGENMHLIASRFEAFEQVNQCWIIGGIGSKSEEEILCSVTFIGNSRWSCKFKNEIIMYNGTEYELQIKGRSKKSNAYEKDIRNIYDEKSSKNIIEVINIVKAQSHGTMLIISEDAKSEAIRLGELHRAIRIDSLKINEQDSETILALSSIDGSILMNEDCICYSIGTILDGNAEIYSNLGRGSRYNSAYAYIYNMKNQDKRCAAVVISEDGMVDVITTKNINNHDNDMYSSICADDRERMYEEMYKDVYEEKRIDFWE